MAHPWDHSTLICGCEELIVMLRTGHGRDVIIVSVQHYCRYAYPGLRTKPAFGVLGSRISGRKPVTMPVGVNGHGDEIRVIK